jgi:hypothetical protein
MKDIPTLGVNNPTLAINMGSLGICDKATLGINRTTVGLNNTCLTINKRKVGYNPLHQRRNFTYILPYLLRNKKGDRLYSYNTTCNSNRSFYGLTRKHSSNFGEAPSFFVEKTKFRLNTYFYTKRSISSSFPTNLVNKKSNYVLFKENLGREFSSRLRYFYTTPTSSGAYKSAIMELLEEQGDMDEYNPYSNYNMGHDLEDIMQCEHI